MYRIICAYVDLRFSLKKKKNSAVARAFPGGRLAHPDGQNEKEHK